LDIVLQSPILGLNKKRTRKEVLVFTGNSTQALAGFPVGKAVKAKVPSFHFKGAYALAQRFLLYSAAVYVKECAHKGSRFGESPYGSDAKRDGKGMEEHLHAKNFSKTGGRKYEKESSFIAGPSYVSNYAASKRVW